MCFKAYYFLYIMVHIIRIFQNIIYVFLQNCKCFQGDLKVSVCTRWRWRCARVWACNEVTLRFCQTRHVKNGKGFARKTHTWRSLYIIRLLGTRNVLSSRHISRRKIWRWNTEFIIEIIWAFFLCYRYKSLKPDRLLIQWMLNFFQMHTC